MTIRPDFTFVAADGRTVSVVNSHAYIQAPNQDTHERLEAAKVRAAYGTPQDQRPPSVFDGDGGYGWFNVAVWKVISQSDDRSYDEIAAEARIRSEEGGAR